MKGIYLGLGSNLGDKKNHIETAILLIGERIGKILKKSSIHLTKAWGNTNQPDFLNMVIEIETPLSPEKLLEEILKIEIDMGRIRQEKWGARIIDIDILLYGNEIIDTPKLKIPHPHMQERDFVMIPLKEIGGNLI